MTAEQRKRIASLYESARARRSEDRAKFVIDACPDDDLVRREVQALLDQSDPTDRFLGNPALNVAVAPVAVSARSDLIGRTIGDYRFERRLGAGGMGEVYRAHDRKLGRDVAIKVLPEEFVSSSDRLVRFEREARVLAALNHPNIGAIYGTVEAEGVHGLVLELADGITLAERLDLSSSRRGVSGLPLPLALAIARQIALALEAAHDRGVIHRDLKPANIMLLGPPSTDDVPSGRPAEPATASAIVVKVLDFGLGKLAGDTGSGPHSTQATAAETREGVVMGTAAYMSPEQARGQPVDRRTDTWAFGCVFYEMLTGRQAFGRPTIADTLTAVLERDVDWSLVPAGTPAGVIKVLRRCLEKQASRRLRDVGDARLEIEDALAGSGEYGASGGSRTAAGGSQWRTRWVFVAVACGLVLLALQAWRWMSAPLSVVTAVRSRPFVTSASEEYSSRISPDGQSVSFLADVGGTTRILVRDIDGSEVQQVSLPPGRVLSQVWSPDGRQLACLLRQDDQLLLQIVQVGEDGPPVQTVLIPIQPAPNRGRLLRWVDRAVYLQLNGLNEISLQRIDLDRAIAVNISDWPVTGSFRYFDVSSDGRRVAYTLLDQGQEDLWIADLDGSSAKRLTNDRFTDRFPLWSGANSTVAFQSNRGGQLDIYEISPDSGLSRALTFSPTAEEPESTSMDGTVMSIRQVSSEVDLWIWNPDRSIQTARLTDDALADFSPTASVSGWPVVFQRSRLNPLLAEPTDSSLVIGSLETSGFELRQAVTNGYAPRISPDGLRLAYLQSGSEAVRATLVVKNLQTQETISLTSTAPRPPNSTTPMEWAQQNVAWNSASTELYFVDRPNGWALRRYRVGASAAEAPSVVADTGQVIHDLHVSPDGRELVYVVSGPNVRSGVSTPNLSAVCLLDIASGTSREIARLESPVGSVYARGWLPGGGIVVVRPIRSQEELSTEVEVIVASRDGRSRSVGRIERSFLSTTRLDPGRATLFLTRSEGGIHNVYAVAIGTGRLRRITDNTSPSVTYSAVVPIDRESTLVVKTERRSDIYLIAREAETHGPAGSARR